MSSPDRFFSATVVPGRLHILGLARGGSWNAARLEWRQEAEVDVLMNPRAGDRKVVTKEELEAIVMTTTARTRFLWIHESLVEDARRLWERANEETA
jgi:hypothetical protein